MRIPKYRNRKVTVNGIEFDSAKETRRFCELSLLEKAGAITELQRQVKFVLFPAQYEAVERYSDKTGKRLKDGKRLLEKECAYIADFSYMQDGRRIVEDTKGFRTKDYIIKRKAMLWFYGIRIKEI